MHLILLHDKEVSKVANTIGKAVHRNSKTEKWSASYCTDASVPNSVCLFLRRYELFKPFAFIHSSNMHKAYQIAQLLKQTERILSASIEIFVLFSGHLFWKELGCTTTGKSLPRFSYFGYTDRHGRKINPHPMIYSRKRGDIKVILLPHSENM